MAQAEAYPQVSGVAAGRLARISARPRLDASGQWDAGRSPARASRTLDLENHVRIHALRRRISSANGAGSRTVLAGGWSQWSQVSGFSEHRTCDVTCSRMKGLTSVGEWLSLVEHLVRDQGVGGSNPLSPTNFSLAFSIVYGAFCPSLFDEFRYIRYNRRQFKADAILLSPLSAEGNVLFDFIVEVAYVLSRMTHPVLVKTFGAVGIVPQVRFSEATESMVSRLVCSAVRVDVVHSGAPRSCNRIVLLLGRGPWVAGNNSAYPKGVHLTTSSGRS